MRLFPATASAYPSEVAMAQLTAKWAAASIWALAVLGSATLYQAETEGLIQVLLHIPNRLNSIPQQTADCDPPARLYILDYSATLMA